MLGRTNGKVPVPEPPSPKELEYFNETGRRGPSKKIGELRIDVTGPVRSAWNRKAAQRFRRTFQKSRIYTRWPKEDIEEAFLRHVETIRSHYHQQNGSVSSNETDFRRSRAARRSRLKTVRAIFLSLFAINEFLPAHGNSDCDLLLRARINHVCQIR